MRLTHTFLIVGSLLGLMQIAPAQESGEKHRIADIEDDGRKLGVWANGRWLDTQLIMVELDPIGGVLPKSPICKAYFFDRDKKLVEVRNEPSKVWDDDGAGLREMVFPEKARRDGHFVIYYALNGKLEGKKSDRAWKAVLVVFGDGDRLVGKLKGNGEITDYEFPEKEKVLAQK